ncbi:MAG: DUF721 domain-containing protein [Deltaproteobacteria bacterium]|nr:DUF721 domain-containing protein [Deltaproteobacteria bacterium]
MSRRHRSYEPIGTAHIGCLLAEALRDPRRVREALGVWPAWEEAVGPQVARATRPFALRDGVLTVHVKNAVWMQELSLQRVSLLRRVRRVPAGAQVKSLRFRLAPQELQQPEATPAPQLVGTAPIPYEIARAIRGASSPGLRGAMIRLAARWAGLQYARGLCPEK